MRNDTITFELATHYLPKVALRTERLLQTIQEATHETHPVIHHYALNNLFEITKLTEKPELKSRFLKELMRIEHSFNKTQNMKSSTAFAKLYVQIQVLSHLSGRFGETIHSDSFLQSIRVIQSSHSLDCELYSPQLLFWLESKAQLRQNHLKVWLKELQALTDTVSAYLALLRETAVFEPIEVMNGIFQCSLSLKTNCHLILLRMDKNAGVVPKIQIGHHGLNIRFCDFASMREIRINDVPLELAICQI